MRVTGHGRRIAASIFAGAALAVTPASTFAQTADAAARSADTQSAVTQSTDIVVEAPRTLPPPRKKSAHAGMPSVVATVRMLVLYNDLDLSKPDQAERLMTRIGRTARDACAYLDQMYPLVRDPECVSRAVAGASVAARAAIAAKQPGGL